LGAKKDEERDFDVLPGRKVGREPKMKDEIEFFSREHRQYGRNPEVQCRRFGI